MIRNEVYFGCHLHCTWPNHQNKDGSREGVRTIYYAVQEISEFSMISEGEQAEGGNSETSDTSSATGSGSGPGDDMVSDLTRQMNPQVFGPSDGGAAPAGFAGGTNTTSGSAADEPLADTGPVSIYPIDEGN